MSSSSHIMSVSHGRTLDPASGNLEGDLSLMAEFSGDKWPVWLRLITIVGLSAGLWSAIIWLVMAIFG
jgi:hypothetical protein